MSKYLRYEKALQSKVYQELVHEAADLLTTRGTFSKNEVLIEAGYVEIGDTIRWDYVRRMIEEEYQTELYGLGPAYFRRHSKEQERRFPANFVAGGNGRGTVGYAIACKENGHFVVQCLLTKRRLQEGLARSAEKTKQIGINSGALPAPSATELLPSS